MLRKYEKKVAAIERLSLTDPDLASGEAARLVFEIKSGVWPDGSEAVVKWFVTRLNAVSRKANIPVPE